MAYDVAEMERYIRQQAQARGIDPDIAVRVARSEGLGQGIWQSNVRDPRRGREPSYGPFQLLVGGENGWPGGMGNDFQRQTGLDPSDPANVHRTVDFALDQAAQGGWGPWFGARHAGIGNRQGIPGTTLAGRAARQPAVSVEAGAAAPPMGPPLEIGVHPNPPTPDIAGAPPIDEGFMEKMKALIESTDGKEGFAGIFNAMGGGQGQQTNPQAEAHKVPIQSALPGMEAGDAARVQASQSMMNQLLERRNKRMPGLSMMG